MKPCAASFFKFRIKRILLHESGAGLQTLFQLFLGKFAVKTNAPRAGRPAGSLSGRYRIESGPLTPGRCGGRCSGIFLAGRRIHGRIADDPAVFHFFCPGILRSGLSVQAAEAEGSLCPGIFIGIFVILFFLGLFELLRMLTDVPFPFRTALFPLCSADLMAFPGRSCSPFQKADEGLSADHDTADHKKDQEHQDSSRHLQEMLQHIGNAAGDHTAAVPFLAAELIEPAGAVLIHVGKVAACQFADDADPEKDPRGRCDLLDDNGILRVGSIEQRCPEHEEGQNVGRKAEQAEKDIPEEIAEGTEDPEIGKEYEYGQRKQQDDDDIPADDLFLLLLLPVLISPGLLGSAGPPGRRCLLCLARFMGRSTRFRIPRTSAPAGSGSGTRAFSAACCHVS